MGLEGVLLGAHAEGVRNLLAVTGDPPHVGDYPGSRGVYEIDSIGLVQLVTRSIEGEDYVGKSLDAPTSFFCGVAVNPTADDLPLELDRFRRKVGRGRSLRHDPGALRARVAGALLATCSAAGRSPCFSACGHFAVTRWHCGSTTRFPASRCPRSCSTPCATPGRTAPAVGLERARALVAAARSRVAGIYVIPPFKQPEAALDLFAEPT